MSDPSASDNSRIFSPIRLNNFHCYIHEIHAVSWVLVSRFDSTCHHFLLSRVSSFVNLLLEMSTSVTLRSNNHQDTLKAICSQVLCVDDSNCTRLTSL